MKGNSYQVEGQRAVMTVEVISPSATFSSYASDIQQLGMSEADTHHVARVSSPGWK